MCLSAVLAIGTVVVVVGAYTFGAARSRPIIIHHRNNRYGRWSDPRRGPSFSSPFRRRKITATTATVPRTSSPPSSDSALCASLRGEDNDNDNDNGSNREPDGLADRIRGGVLPFLAVAGWPAVAACGLPALVSHARSFPPNSPDQFAAVTLLIVANRVYLYALGLTIVATAALRASSAGDPAELGQRLTRLTEELLVLDKPLDLASATAAAEPAVTPGATTTTTTTPTTTAAAAAAEPPTTTTPEPSFVRKLVDDSGLEENLDGVDAGTQALVLPVLVAGLLAASVATLPIFSEGLSSFLSADGSSPSPLSSLAPPEWISEILPFLSQAWNALLLTLFARAEFRRLGYELFRIGGGGGGGDGDADAAATVGRTRIVVECGLAVAVTIFGAYILRYWPAQNFVNSAIAVLVARAIRLDSFNAVAGALALLTLYDGVSVLLLPGIANAASSGGVASSAMGSVALQKLSSAGFQPGLLVTKIDGNQLTGTLGLGDAVFPSILASFLKRFDDDCNQQQQQQQQQPQSSSSNNSRLFEASLVGYMVGCGACEFAPAIGTRGVPALLFIVPAMGAATVLAAARAGRLDDVRRYNNNNGRSGGGNNNE